MSYNDPNIQSAHARLIQETLERERKNKDLKILISKEVQKLQESAQNGEAIEFIQLLEHIITQYPTHKEFVSHFSECLNLCLLEVANKQSTETNSQISNQKT